MSDRHRNVYHSSSNSSHGHKSIFVPSPYLNFGTNTWILPRELSHVDPVRDCCWMPRQKLHWKTVQNKATFRSNRWAQRRQVGKFVHRGSYPISETNFKDFSKTFQGLRLIFQGSKFHLKTVKSHDYPGYSRPVQILFTSKLLSATRSAGCFETFMKISEQCSLP